MLALTSDARTLRCLVRRRAVRVGLQSRSRGAVDAARRRRGRAQRGGHDLRVVRHRGRRRSRPVSRFQSGQSPPASTCGEGASCPWRSRPKNTSGALVPPDDVEEFGPDDDVVVRVCSSGCEKAMSQSRAERRCAASLGQPPPITSSQIGGGSEDLLAGFSAPPRRRACSMVEHSSVSRTVADGIPRRWAIPTGSGSAAASTCSSRRNSGGSWITRCESSLRC